MKLERSKKNNLARNMVIVLLVVGIISAIILTFTKAKYKTAESIPLVNGTINYELSDLNLIGVYIEDGSSYTKTDQIPDSGYTLNEEKSYCKIGEEKQDTTITYDMNTKTLNIAPMTTKGTKCYLYFDEQKTLLADAIKRDKTVKTRSLPLTTSSKVEDSTTGTIYKAQDDWGDTYYFAGNPTDNWVRFAGFYWRIIRINGDGSIRMIYQGTSANTTGTGTQLQTSAFNSSYNRSEYVEYMYTSGQQRGNSTNSTIKGVLDSWYSSNLASYADKISKEAGFCGDRNMASGSSWSSTPSSTSYYAEYGRLVQNSSSVNPTFKCSNSTDLYTVSGSSKGNKALSNPIGLITADEVTMAGLPSWSGSTTSNYLYTGQHYWTMSPSRFYSMNGHAYVFRVYSTGHLSDWGVDNTIGVRPVINLSADITIKSGNGSSSTPYEI